MPRDEIGATEMSQRAMAESFGYYLLQHGGLVTLGTAEDGLPIGLQIEGRRLDDALVLRTCAA